jgi:cytoskeletal protein CcmA (bactofilin family)
MSQSTDNQSIAGSTVAVAGAGVRSAVPRSTGQSVIGPTLVIRGEITAEEDLLIRGRVEGTISHDQTLTVHQQGTVVAAVRAKEIHVEGSVEGDLFGTQRVKVCDTGKVEGNVVAPRVAVMDGARLKGMVDMDSDASAIDRRFAEQSGASAPEGQMAADKSASKSSGRKNAPKNQAEASDPANDTDSEQDQGGVA